MEILTLVYKTTKYKQKHKERFTRNPEIFPKPREADYTIEKLHVISKDEVRGEVHNSSVHSASSVLTRVARNKGDQMD